MGPPHGHPPDASSILTQGGRTSSRKALLDPEKNLVTENSSNTTSAQLREAPLGDGGPLPVGLCIRDIQRTKERVNHDDPFLDR